MWYIKYFKDNDSIEFHSTIYKSKADAFAVCRTQFLSNDISCEVLSTDTSLIFDDVEAPNLVISILDETTGDYIKYGIIESISNYLVFVRKFNGDLVELTKSKINTKILERTAIVV